MQRLVDYPGFLRANYGGMQLRQLYHTHLNGMDYGLLSDFARHCILGSLGAVEEAVKAGNAPDLLGWETPYKFGYATLAVYGAQRLVISTDPRIESDHPGTLQYLLHMGAPPNLADFAGYTALHHACRKRARPELVQILICAEADPNQQDRWGGVPIMSALQCGCLKTMKALLEAGASVDVEDGDGMSPAKFAPQAGPVLTAVVQQWKRKREGVSLPLDKKACATCGGTGCGIKLCARCNAIWYCSRDCQKRDWQTHKLRCTSFHTDATVSLKPHYEDIGEMFSTPDVVRSAFGYAVSKPPERETRSVHVPHIRPGETKRLIIKVQVPYDIVTGGPRVEEQGDLMVFDKKRELVCRIRRRDDEVGYLRLSRTVVAKGAGRLKAYFVAEMPSVNLLIVKISEVLAEQAF
ncbi:ankyrin [Cubamyces lactineus]|nr:ankyrin [Cubamyces lactineus]